MSVISFFLLSDLNLNVKVKINSLRGKKLPDEIDLWATHEYSPVTCKREAELFVTCQIFSNSKPLGLQSSTTYRCFPTEQMSWNEWLTFPVKYRDLSPTSQLVFTVWEIRHTSVVTETSEFKTFSSQQAVPLGGTCLPMFNKKGILKLGRRKLNLWEDVEGDGSVNTKTPYKTKKAVGMDKLEKTIRRYEQKELPKVRWLDSLTLRRIEKMQQAYYNAGVTEDGMFLTVEFPGFKHPIVYHQVPCNQSLPDILPFKQNDRLFVLHDPEMSRDNPIENKYHKLARSSKGLTDSNLKPNIKERNEIHEIINDPVKHLKGEERQLLWRFRFSLTENKKALPKFLRCVDWKDNNETKQAEDLLKVWAPVDLADALQLLSKDFTNSVVRQYAVTQLEAADEEDLSSYLLQLVQALRYEEEYPSPLSKFLIDRATTSLPLANFFHWFLTVEQEDREKGAMYSDVHMGLKDALKAKNMEWYNIIEAQAQLVHNLIGLVKEVKSRPGNAKKKTERLKTLLGAEGEMKEFSQMDPIYMPIRPNIQITGISGDKSFFLKSSLAPLMCYCTTTEDQKPYRVIFKNGDDLRQDQLIIQMINLMDSLLKKVKLDLKLTPYRVLATSSKDGFVEFVADSDTLSGVLEKYDGDIRKYFHYHNPKPQQLAKAVDTFVKSCAGYCVITYILGIGDRHMDNIMLTNSGHMFHIDFGFIFGKDPKPRPPPMKFCKEMVEAMGGANSSHYAEFRNYCCLAFNILRKHAGLILNLLSLMGDAGIPDLMDDVNKNLLKVQKNFRLDLDDERADFILLGLLDESVSALFPQVVDKLHKWAVYWK
eukprot:CAMPEP_0175147654 /NCGR_PEP_ID=MMETSP0087-20121206/16121_1 /TAXON_ID=136419 /ORGANISM="Unknown Unknown, Strain D1" /LENGTH=820 /DNA_ID=CAMNT_0016432885 /DNA_START=12 /DNA_END=2474 /DNA_ORIENTATION=+